MGSQHNLRRFIRRLADRDKLAYSMVVAFGLAFLMITLYFQFGNTVVLLDNGQTLEIGGYIGETRLWVRIMEGLISLGLVALGIERLVARRRRVGSSK